MRRNRSSESPLTRRRFLQQATAATASLAALDAGRPVAAAPAAPAYASPGAVSALQLTAVRLTGGPLKHAQDLDAAYLLTLEPDRMLAFFRLRAGLIPKAAHYGGWEGEGRNLNGHFAGHYLSAVSLMYAATGDPKFKQRADYVVSEFKAVQGSDGYIGALEGGHEHFAEIARGDIRSGGFDLNGMWSPWYCQHKIFAGLRDAYRHTGNKMALEVETRFAGWVGAVVSGLDHAQVQKMLATEFGGMNEVLADLAVDAGDTKFLALSDRFQHRAFLDPLIRAQDHLDGLHGNTQIPKIVGSATRHKITGNPEDAAAANFFWDAVVAHHSFATGGHGKDEYFGPPDALGDRIDGRTAETCNVYNMLKLSRQLFAQKPAVKYADFQERALFNHILGSIAPDNGQTCYMVPVGQGVEREYQGMFTDFTCCVGTGMENHALHGSGIYFADAEDTLYVNLYTPSTAVWKNNVHLTMATTFPEGDSATISVTTDHLDHFALLLRRPRWAGDGFQITLNGKPVPVNETTDGYVAIKRAWTNGDTLVVTLPKALRAERLADNPNRAAILWGPLVLAADLGPQAENRQGDAVVAPAIVAEGDLSTWLKPVAGQAGKFRAEGAGRDPAKPDQVIDIEFAPFYALHRRIYAAYQDIYTPAEWQKRAADLAAAQAKHKALEDATIGFVQPGMMQSERDSNFQGDDSSTVVRVLDRPARRGKSWFSFDVAADPGRLAVLIVTYCTAESRKRVFTVSVEGQSVGEQVIPGARPGSPAGKFFDVEYALPPDATHGKQKVTVRFQAASGSEIAAVFGIRTVRADTER